MNINVRFIETAEISNKPLDVDGLRKSIVSAVDHALEFLSRQGFEFEQDLEIAYVAGKCALDANMILRANLKTDDYKTTHAALAQQQLYLSMSHSLKISDEAVDEFASVLLENNEGVAAYLRHSAPYELDNETDIFIYDTAKLDHLIAMMVHELWHLIEAKQGVFNGPEFIHEGTATFVQKRFMGLSPNHEHFNETGTPNHAFYDLAAKIVNEELKAAQGNFSTILDPAFRKKVTARVRTEVLPIFFEVSNNNIPKEVTAAIINNPNYAGFVENPSRETLINAFRLMGASKWAEEMDKQDTSKYLSYMRRVIGLPF